jgi:hypothetical protein
VIQLEPHLSRDVEDALSDGGGHVFNSWFALTFQAAQLGWEAQNVVALRFVRLAGGGAAGAKEAQLMVTDKLAALTEAQLAAVSKCPDRGWS